MSAFTNATLMITGGTGSFGSTVLKHFLDSDLKEIRIFSRDETKQDDMRHGEKLYETLMTREERLRSEDMGNYYRVAADNRDLNYDKYVVKGQVHTMADESYTSHNTNRLDVEGTVKKILTTDYVQSALREQAK